VISCPRTEIGHQVDMQEAYSVVPRIAGVQGKELSAGEVPGQDQKKDHHLWAAQQIVAWRQNPTRRSQHQRAVARSSPFSWGPVL
jgi:hypothetical protein